MKTSEYIRYCVYKYLEPDNKRYIINCYLCLVLGLGNYPGPEPDNETSVNKKLISMIIDDQLVGAAFLNTTPSLYNVIGQQERFMFAEFLALYFEDLGD